MIVFTGASGFVGSQLVPLIFSRDDILLVSRDVAQTRATFPNTDVCNYSELPHRDLADSVFIHLAARNNDRPGTVKEFAEANVDLLLRVAAIARDCGASRFINLCSTHALDAGRDDPYGASKAEGARQLSAFWPSGAINLYIPAVYGTRFQGRLAAINRLPGIIQQVVRSTLSLAKPMISMENLAIELRQLATDAHRPQRGWHGERYAADPVLERGVYPFVMRSIDLLAVLAVVAFAGWAMALIALYIRWDSRGPAIFAQQRVGRNGREFICYKFRTMTLGTANEATHNISAAAVTRAGRFLRRTKLDELPQIVNVLKGEMNLVGPRPCLPMQAELIALRRDRGVLQMRPGITGLAQVETIDMSDPARLAAWDDRYRAFRTLLGDIILLIRTVTGGGSGDRISHSG